jgi:hypothetical protein
MAPGGSATRPTSRVLPSEARDQPARLDPKRARAYTRGGEFHGVANEPALQAATGVGFGMELDTEDIGAQRERLVATQGCLGKTLRPLGNGEAVAVPVQHRNAREVAQRRFTTSVG